MKIKLFTISIILSSVVSAAPTEGTIIKMEFGPAYGDIVHVDMSADNPTTCANNLAGYDYSFDSGTEVGKKMYAAFLAAQRSKSVIKVSGTGACTINTWGLNTENVNWIQAK